MVLLLAVVAVAATVIAYLTEQAWAGWVGLFAAVLGAAVALRQLLADRARPGTEVAVDPDVRAPVDAVDENLPEDRGQEEEPEESAASAAPPADVSDDDRTESSDAAPVAADASVAEQAPGATRNDVVHVVPGRRRFHRAGCSLLQGKDTEQITEDDARDEGFTACSRCAG